MNKQEQIKSEILKAWKILEHQEYLETKDQETQNKYKNYLVNKFYDIIDNINYMQK